MERRTLRRDKLERVELQQKVENELRARHTVQQELTSVSTQLAESERCVFTLHVNGLLFISLGC